MMSRGRQPSPVCLMHKCTPFAEDFNPIFAV